MSLPTINDCIIFGDPLDWSDPPRLTRSWATKIAGGVNGSEDRSVCRTTPLQRLEFSVLSWSIQDRAQLNARIEAALKSGRAVCPLWPRPQRLPSDTPIVDQVTTLGAWTWSPGDLAFFVRPDTYEVVVLDAETTGQTLHWQDALKGNYTGHAVYPAIAGTLSVGDCQALSDSISRVKLAIQEPLASAAAASPDTQPQYIPGYDGSDMPPWYSFGSGYFWGLYEDQNPNGLLTAQQIADHQTVVRRELELYAETMGFTVTAYGDTVWQYWTAGAMRELYSMLWKSESGDLEPHPLTDTKFWLSQGLGLNILYQRTP
ncbi:MAG: hypothetical protein M1608_17420 [Candidatus Omnitrophica bacterium]|nr:hypothetical protein [Candidatus Omnitrophota bacterium]